MPDDDKTLVDKLFLTAGTLRARFGRNQDSNICQQAAERIMELSQKPDPKPTTTTKAKTKPASQTVGKVS